MHIKLEKKKTCKQCDSTDVQGIYKINTRPFNVLNNKLQ